MKINFYSKIFLTLFLFITTYFFHPGNQLSAQQTAKVYSGGYPYVGGYLEYLPDDYNTNPTKKYPIMIFFHGIGEVGNGTSDIWKVDANGPPKLIQNGTWPSSFPANGTTYKFIVISPQSARFWTADDVNYAVQQSLAIYGSRIDMTRIYLTGLSGGGGGLWDYLAGSPANRKLVAATVICAGASWWGSQERVDTIVQSSDPIWAFHNIGDPTVPVSNAYGWQTYLTAAGLNPPEKLTIYNQNGHDCWTQTYDPSSSNPNNIYAWMLGFTRPGSGIPSNNPVANAGLNASITLPSQANLDGTGSTDAYGTINSYNWTKISGPTGDIITNATASKTTVSFTTAGSYVYQLTVKDNNNNIANASITITVNAAILPPVANAGTNQTITLPALASLDGTGSTDASGTINSYTWIKTSGPTGDLLASPNASKSSVSFTNSGTYVYQLTVKDNNGNTGSSTVTITVNPAPLPPIANAGTNQTIILPALASLDGTASTDASGTINSYTWIKTSGPTGDLLASPNTSKSSVSFTNSGTYVYQLTVKDNNGNTGSSTVTITVNPALLPPIASAGPNVTVTLPSQASLDGSGSTDASGTINSYTWIKISGPGGDTIYNPGSSKTTISFSSLGNYVYQLTVKDNNNNSSNSTVTVTVINSNTIVPPEAWAGPPQTITLPNKLTLNGSGSIAQSGYIVSYSWKKISGPLGDTIYTPN